MLAAAVFSFIFFICSLCLDWDSIKATITESDIILPIELENLSKTNCSITFFCQFLSTGIIAYASYNMRNFFLVIRDENKVITELSAHYLFVIAIDCLLETFGVDIVIMILRAIFHMEILVELLSGPGLVISAFFFALAMIFRLEIQQEKKAGLLKKDFLPEEPVIEEKQESDK
ncbi:MAG: hypothetical protein WCR67_07210 [Bacilli bacterium]